MTSFTSFISAPT